MLIAYTTTKTPTPRTTTSKPVRRLSSKRPAWSRAKQLNKLGEAYAQLQRMNGLTFSLWLSEDVAEAARKSGDPTRYLAKRFRSAFGDHIAGTPEYAFCVEVTTPKPHRPHLHGAIAFTGWSMDEIKLALRRAAGIITGASAARQLKLQHFDDARGGPHGWARYTAKSTVATKDYFDNDRLTSMSPTLRNLSSASWEARRHTDA